MGLIAINRNENASNSRRDLLSFTYEARDITNIKRASIARSTCRVLMRAVRSNPIKQDHLLRIITYVIRTIATASV